MANLTVTQGEKWIGKLAIRLVGISCLASSFLEIIIQKNMDRQLSKREKKIAKACIDKGLEAEFREGMENFDVIIRDWREGKFTSNREAYHQLYKAIHTKNKAISGRYDGLSGSHRFMAVAAILNDGYITEDDVKDFSEETKSALNNLLQFWKNI